MKTIDSWGQLYQSPEIEMLDVMNEGMLCSSAEAEHEGYELYELYGW